MAETKELSEKALLALKFDTELRKYCVEMAIYSLGGTEETTIDIASKLEEYILNGKTDTTDKVPEQVFI